MTLQELQKALRDRYLTVFADLPQGQTIAASHAIAMREVWTNVTAIGRPDEVDDASEGARRRRHA